MKFTIMYIWGISYLNSGPYKGFVSLKLQILQSVIVRKKITKMVSI